MIDVLDCLADASIEAHTSFVLTYSLDLVLYDKLIRRRLTTAGATSQVVFCDATCYNSSLDGVDSTSKIGRSYSVTPVDREGAFHAEGVSASGPTPWSPHHRVRQRDAGRAGPQRRDLQPV